MKQGTTCRDLTRAMLFKSYFPSARMAAIEAADRIGADYLFGAYVATDECICEVKVNKQHTRAWAVEADCPAGLF